MRSPSSWLLAVAVVLAAGNLWATFRRSGIPLALDGRVERIDVRQEKHPGVDDVPIVTIAGREIHLDPKVAAQIRKGDTLSKAAWSAELATPRGTVQLSTSRDFRRMLIAMPLLVVLAVSVRGRRKGLV